MDNKLSEFDLGDISEGYIKISFEGKTNFIDKDGKLLSKIWFDSVRIFSEGYAGIKREGKWNFIDKTGELLSDNWFDFDDVGNFSEGFVSIGKNGEGRNFIDKKGKILSNMWFDGYLGNFSEGYARVEQNKEYTDEYHTNFINIRGELLSGIWFDQAKNFSEGYASVKREGKYNFIDKEGKLLSDSWLNFYDVGNFSEGYAMVTALHHLYNEYRVNFIDKEGELLSDKWFNQSLVFSEGYASIEREGKWNFIDRTGKLLSDSWFDFDDVGNFSEGFVSVKREGKYNFIDKEGKLLSDNWFDDIRHFSEGFVSVEREGKWSFIDRTGKLLSDNGFDDARSFSEGYAKVKNNGQWNFIDKVGRLLISEKIISIIHSSLGISSSINQDYIKFTKNEGNEQSQVKDKKRKNSNKKLNYMLDEKREKIKESVFKKYGKICSECGATTNLDIHHILPRHMGGKDILSNLKILCRNCHEDLHGYEIDDTQGTGKKELSKKLKLITKAKKENLKLKITYEKYKEDTIDYITKRTIDPIEVYYENGRQYLKAFCYLRNQQRVFRISRITKMEIE